MEAMALIEIAGLPNLKMVDLSMAMNNQRVSCFAYKPSILYFKPPISCSFNTPREWFQRGDRGTIIVAHWLHPAFRSEVG